MTPGPSRLSSSKTTPRSSSPVCRQRLKLLTSVRGARATRFAPAPQQRRSGRWSAARVTLTADSGVATAASVLHVERGAGGVLAVAWSTSAAVASTRGGRDSRWKVTLTLGRVAVRASRPPPRETTDTLSTDRCNASVAFPLARALRSSTTLEQFRGLSTQSPHAPPSQSLSLSLLLLRCAIAHRDTVSMSLDWWDEQPGFRTGGIATTAVGRWCKPSATPTVASTSPQSYPFIAPRSTRTPV